MPNIDDIGPFDERFNEAISERISRIEKATGLKVRTTETWAGTFLSLEHPTLSFIKLVRAQILRHEKARLN